MPRYLPGPFRAHPSGPPGAARSLLEVLPPCLCELGFSWLFLLSRVVIFLLIKEIKH